MNENTAKNLYEYADYFKKSLQLTVVSILLAFVTGFAFLASYIFGIILIIVLVGISIAIIVLGILMILRLANAKNSSPHPELIKAFTFFLISLILSAIVSIIDISLNFYVSLGLSVFNSIVGISALVCDLLGWIAFDKYIKVYASEVGGSPGFQMVADGIRTYLITNYIMLGTTALTLIAFMAPTLLLVLALAILIVSIIMLVAQFKIANGLLIVFGGGTIPKHTTEPIVPLAPSTSPSTTEVRFCSNCGTKLMLGAKFCTSCGSTVE